MKRKKNRDLIFGQQHKISSRKQLNQVLVFYFLSFVLNGIEVAWRRGTKSTKLTTSVD